MVPYPETVNTGGGAGLARKITSMVFDVLSLESLKDILAQLSHPWFNI